MKRLRHRSAARLAALTIALISTGITMPPAASAAPATAAAPAPAALPALDLNPAGSFSDSFAVPVSSHTHPMYGLNVGLNQRQTVGATSTGTTQVPYTRLSGHWDPKVLPPEPWYVQAGKPTHPNKLAFLVGTSAVMLGAPALADASGHYTISTTIDPIVGNSTGGDWGSLMLSRSRRSTGFVTNSDVDLGLTVASDGRLALFRGEATPFWAHQVTTPPSGAFAVSLTISTGADKLVRLTVNGESFAITGPSSVTAWPTTPYLYLGAQLSDPAAVTTFGDGQGPGLSVSRVDTLALSSAKRFVDTFDGSYNDPEDYGLNRSPGVRQPTVASSGYTRVSGLWNSSTPPPAWYSQVNHPEQPNKLSFFIGPSAVRLDKPVTADRSGRYTVHAVLDPIIGERTGQDWSSLAVGSSKSGDGWITGSDIALGVLVRSNGRVQLYQNGQATWATEESVPAADSYDVTITAATDAVRQATITVNGTSFAVTTTRDLPRDGYVYLGSYGTNANSISTVDDLRASMLGGVNYYGYYDIADPTPSTNNGVNHGPEVAGWTNMNQYLAVEPSTGYLDYCAPQSCVLDTGHQMFLYGWGAPGHLRGNAKDEMLRMRREADGNIDKIGAVYLLDEPYLQGYPGHHISPADLQTGVTFLRETFGDTMLTMTYDVGTLHQPGFPVPQDVDLVGFDRYCASKSLLENDLTVLKNKLSSPNQHLYLIPESAPQMCDNGTDADIAAAQAKFVALADADPRIVYLMNYGWWVAPAAGSSDPLHELPLTVTRQKEIGGRIMNF